jgi:heme/copper-type cytochrome/quinol oxidase subunit 4
MERQQQRDKKQTTNELRWYSTGFLVLVGLWIISFILGSLVEPLRLLQLRLALNGVAVVYFLSVHFSYFYLRKRSKLNEIQHDIIIWFNGKEVGRM